MRRPLGPGVVLSIRREQTRAYWLLVCISQPAAAELVGSGSPFCQQVVLPTGTFAAASSNPGLMATLVGEMEKPGHELAADDCATAAEQARADAAANNCSGLK